MKSIYNILGLAAVAVGGIGIVVPILPTTPFLILAAICFGKGSTRLQSWLYQTKFFGTFIKNYECGTGVPKKDKATAVFFLWTLLIISIIMINMPWISILLVIIGIAVTTHIILLKGTKTVMS